MSETPKNKVDEENDGPPENDTWSEDQKERSYYYDDSHGYETYKPDEDENDCDDEAA